MLVHGAATDADTPPSRISLGCTYGYTLHALVTFQIDHFTRPSRQLRESTHSP